jgi:hypothetical protein
MKRLSFLAILFASSSINLSVAQGALTIQPEKPKPGETVKLSYNIVNTSLLGEDSAEAYAYLLEGALPLIREVKLTKAGNIYTGEVATNDTTAAVFFTFFKGDKKDNNNDEGYFTLLFDNNGNPVPGARKKVGSAFSSYGGSIWGLK